MEIQLLMKPYQLVFDRKYAKSLKDLKPISLCITFYKIATKENLQTILRSDVGANILNAEFFYCCFRGVELFKKQEV